VIAGTVLFALVAAMTASACSSQEPAHPPLLGNCVPVDDASCNPQVGMGTGGPPGGDAGGGDGPEDSEAATCAVAANYFQPANSRCLPCIEQLQDGCCMALLACASTAGCPPLLACAQQPCDAGSATCLAACEARWPKAVTAYEDLANCVFASCNQQCMDLMLPTQVSSSDP
jgi:hypothetical protein